MSHRTASVELRERYAIDDPRPVLPKLVASPEIEEAVLLSTCNRVELMVWAREPDAARLRLRSCFERELAGDGGAVRSGELDAALYELGGRRRRPPRAARRAARSTRWSSASRRSSGR